MKNDNLFASDLILDYLSKENLKFIQTQLETIFEKSGCQNVQINRSGGALISYYYFLFESLQNVNEYWFRK